MTKMTVYSLSIVQMKKIQDVMLKACAENEAIRRNISTLERRYMNEVGRWQDTMLLGKSEK